MFDICYSVYLHVFIVLKNSTSVILSVSSYLVSLTQWSTCQFTWPIKLSLLGLFNFDGCIHLKDIYWYYLDKYDIINFYFFTYIGYLKRLKNNVKNKAWVEGSICNVYLVEEISTFCSYYFEDHVSTKIGNEPHNCGGESSSSFPKIRMLFWFSNK